MKSKNLILALLFMAVTALALCACKEEEQTDPDPVSEIMIDASEVNVAAQGGEYTIGCRIINPVEGAEVGAKCSMDWISGFTFDQENVLGFRIAENAGGWREAVVELTYEGAKPQSFKVLQAAREEQSQGPFRLEVSGITEISATLKVTPEDKKIKYIFFVKSVSQLREMGIETEDQLFEADKAFLQADADYYGDTFENTVEHYARRGDYKDGSLSGLVPGTDYVVYAYGIALDGTELSRTTDISSRNFTTLSVPQIEADFKFDIRVDGPNASIEVTAVDYAGPFYFDVISEFNDRTDIDLVASMMWMKMSAILFEVGYAPEDIIAQLCDYTLGSYEYDLDAEKEYILFAVAISEEKALPCSSAVHEKFVTEGVSASDNRIGISVENITSNSAELVFDVTNEDPYAAVFIESSEIAGLDEDAIIAKCIEEGAPQSTVGDRTVPVEGLAADTEYSVLAFGYEGGVATTGLFRSDFRTNASQIDRYSIRMEFGDYYDLEALAQLDDSWTQYIGSGDAILPFKVITTPEDAQKYYYTIIDVDKIENQGGKISESLLEFMLGNSGYKDKKESVYLLDYGIRYVAAAMIEDADGNRGQLVYSEEFTMSGSGASDPSGFAVPAYVPVKPVGILPVAMK